MPTTSPAAGRSRLAGTALERKGWVLLALLAAVMIVFGLQAYFSSESPTDAIAGSACCTGHRLSEAPAWVFRYGQELGKYLGTYMAGTGLFALAAIVFALRSGRRWAWIVCWYVPVLFLVHGFALGSFPFDIAPLALTTLGQLLMIRPVFGDRVAAASGEALPANLPAPAS